MPRLAPAPTWKHQNRPAPDPKTQLQAHHWIWRDTNMGYQRFFWYMNGMWMGYEWDMNGMWMVYEWYTNGLWMGFQWDINDGKPSVNGLMNKTYEVTGIVFQARWCPPRKVLVYLQRCKPNQPIVVAQYLEPGSGCLTVGFWVFPWFLLF